ncbi:hypothetical protein BGZ47_007999 [Haplosporangium gracile]|nr:hypothetical protein BGZ47_007999 [Haplosporangium gracile]
MCMLSRIQHQPQVSCVIISFVDPDAAVQFVDYTTIHDARIMQRSVEVHWNDDRPHSLSLDVIHALRRGATREVHASNALKVGGMRNNKMLQDFQCLALFFAFINFADIVSATAAVQGIKAVTPEYALTKCRIDYAHKDIGGRGCSRIDGALDALAMDISDTSAMSNNSTNPMGVQEMAVNGAEDALSTAMEIENAV